MTHDKKIAEKHAEKLIELLPQLLRGLLKREDNFLTQGKISFPQMLAMEHLSHVGKCRMSEFANSLSIQMGSATGLVDRMVGLGFLKRYPDPKDRRVVQIGLTTKGEAVVKNIFSQKKKIMTEVFTKISNENSGQYVNVLEKIVGVLSEDTA